MADKNIEILNEIINQITLYVPLLIIISGTIGSLCNVITFTSRQLRFSSCAFYFLCSTIFDLLYLLFGGITRLMIDHFSNMLLNRSVLLCKCRTYLVVVLPSLSTIFIMLASMDSPFITYTIMLICTMTTLIRIRTSRYRMGFLDNRRRKSIHRNIDRNLITLLITMEAFFDKISLVIYYMNFAKSFPVNTLTSPLFRRVFRQRIINLIR
ncbi:unnamed protein product [Rotaria sp. Silwood1]|nr:unnamed protein product [Rotaria sp. Silwood1]CAF4741718.1 unnamed protein product [Rotaria sp. Silwood1]